MSHDLATKLVVGKIMYKFDKQCRFWGKGALIYLFFIILLKYVAADALGI